MTHATSRLTSDGLRGTDLVDQHPIEAPHRKFSESESRSTRFKFCQIHPSPTRSKNRPFYDSLKSDCLRPTATSMTRFPNLLTAPAGKPGVESIADLIRHPAFTLEQIVSRGAASPDGLWYDQDRSEWVVLLQGKAELRFDSGESLALTAGDPLHIPAHRRHRVERTSPDAVWLALHYQEEPGA